MRTLVEVVARRGPRGRTVLPVVRASGQLAVRRTGEGAVHLVATAFGPLGGDDAEVRLVVEEGARLSVHSVAAAVVLPARGESPPSRQVVRAEVAGVLHLAPEPTVVTARAAGLRLHGPGGWPAGAGADRGGRRTVAAAGRLGGCTAWAEELHEAVDRFAGVIRERDLEVAR